MTKDLAVQKTGELATVQPGIESIIQTAIENGRTGAELKEFLDFARELKADKAKAEFQAAFAAFKAECPSIVKRSTSQFQGVNKLGIKGPRMYADLEDIMQIVEPAARKHGLTISWGESKIESHGNALLMMVPCVIAHVGGHSISGSFPIAVDSKAGCSEQQKYGIASTYARRYSLVSVLGLVGVDQDTDGEERSEKITEDQANDLNDRLIQVNADIPAFKGIFKIEKLADMRAADLSKAHAMIDKKAKKK
jgi:hypothetical protein